MTISTGRLPPVWLRGFSNLPLGISGAIMLIATPQLLAADHVPETQIASITAIALIPGFANFLLSPILDWRFNRRSYAIGLAVISALLNVAALLAIHNLPLLTALLFLSTGTVGLYIAAVSGWLGSLTHADDKNRMGAWMTVANIGGGGVTVVIAVPLLRALPYEVGALILGALMLLPLPTFWLFPAPAADKRLASESFRDFGRDVLGLLRQPAVLVTLLLFLMPTAAFALTNALGGLGHDYSASEKLVSAVGGTGAVIAGLFGSLLMPRTIRFLSPRRTYLMIGGLGALFTLTLIVLPRTPLVFSVAMLGENLFQAAAFAVGNAIILQTIGDDNPLAATQFALLNAATMVPLTYMQAIDGQGYGALGNVNGSYLADGGISLVACLMLAAFLWRIRKRAVPAVA